MTAGPGVSTATVRLGAHLSAEADGAGNEGEMTKARVTFELFKSNNESGVADNIISGVAVDSNGDALVSVNSLAADLYTVKVRVDGTNQFWTANPVGMGVLNIVVATSEQHSHGGGWVADAATIGGKANFGFNLKMDNKEGPVKGNWKLSFLGTDGFNYVVESNGWEGGYLQFSAEPGVSPAVYTRSNFKGRCSVQKVNPANGQVVATWNNYSFEGFTKDGDFLSPQQADAYAFTVWDGNDQVWHQVGSRTSPVTLGSGEIKNKLK
jgi:hypothetical protein